MANQSLSDLLFISPHFGVYLILFLATERAGAKLSQFGSLLLFLTSILFLIHLILQTIGYMNHKIRLVYIYLPHFMASNSFIQVYL